MRLNENTTPHHRYPLRCLAHFWARAGGTIVRRISPISLEGGQNAGVAQDMTFSCGPVIETKAKLELLAAKILAQAPFVRDHSYSSRNVKE